MALLAHYGSTVDTHWVADSGCSMHMTNILHLIREYKTHSIPIKMKLGDNRTILALGSCHLSTTIGTIKNIHHVPEIKMNLYSVSSATKVGLDIKCNSETINVSRNGRSLFAGSSLGGTWLFRFTFEHLLNYTVDARRQHGALRTRLSESLTVSGLGRIPRPSSAAA